MSCLQLGVVLPDVTIVVEHAQDGHPGLKADVPVGVKHYSLVEFLEDRGDGGHLGCFRLADGHSSHRLVEFLQLRSRTDLHGLKDFDGFLIRHGVLDEVLVLGRQALVQIVVSGGDVVLHQQGLDGLEEVGQVGRVAGPPEPSEVDRRHPRG